MGTLSTQGRGGFVFLEGSLAIESVPLTFGITEQVHKVALVRVLLAEFGVA